MPAACSSASSLSGAVFPATGRSAVPVVAVSGSTVVQVPSFGVHVPAGAGTFGIDVMCTAASAGGGPATICRTERRGVLAPCLSRLLNNVSRHNFLLK